MADKEATVYVVDVGKSMNERHHGRDESDLRWGMRYVWDKIATTVGTGRKTLTMGVIAFRTDDTENELAEEDSFENISVVQPLGQVTMTDFRNLREKIQPSNTNEGDAISALVVAIQMIITFCKKLKYTRRIVLVTNGTGSMDADGLADIVSKIKEDSIELTVLGADFDDPEYGFKEEDKGVHKASNEQTLRSLVEDCNGILGTLEQAVSELGIPRLKSVKPVPSYRGYLTLGDPSNYDTAMVIDVERFPRTVVATPPSASNFVVRSAMGPDDTNGQSSMAADNGEAGNGELAAVKSTRTYQVKDEEAPGGKRDVEREELAKGYEYGRTAVHISESDLNVTKLETKAGLEIVGFIPAANFDPYMSLDRSHTVVAQRTNEKAIMAISSFVHALFELESCAIARLVPKDGKDPILVLLSPSIETDYECLVEVELPFAEDVRAYKFPPLDRIVTVSGKVIKEHRNLPNDSLKQAMSDFVDHMDLSTCGTDDDGNPAEYAAFEDTFSPTLHRLNQAIRFRAIHPTDPTPPAHDILLKYTNPPSTLLEEAQPYLTALRTAADIKKVPPKSLSKRGRTRGSRAQETPRSGLDVAALLSTRHTSSTPVITPENAIPDFRQALDAAEDVAAVGRAVEQMGRIVEDWIKFSVGDAGYERAGEGLGVMRKECEECEEAGLWNEFLEGLKGKIEGEQLGGDRREMWWRVKVSGLGPL